MCILATDTIPDLVKCPFNAPILVIYSGYRVMGISFKKFACLHSLMKQRLGRKLFYKTAPEGVLCYKDRLLRPYVLMVAILGAFYKHGRILIADFLKEIPMTLFHTMEYHINIVFLLRPIYRCQINLRP